MKTYHRRGRSLLAAFLAVVMLFSLMPTAFAAQEDNYHDPAEHWQEALNRTNELDANSVVTIETFHCCVCDQDTSFRVFRVPEYTRNGETALTRNVKYSDGTCLDGESKGDLLDGTPGKDAYYTGYHWTKAVCQTCGTFNTNMGATNYSCGKNVYWLYDCAANFFEELPETQTIEQVDSGYHRVTTSSGSYCGFCYGTFKETSSELVRHSMETAIRPELAHDRFVEMDTCADCGYAETAYTAAKVVIADYFGVVDGQPHTVTVSDLSDVGVTTAIRYGNEAGSCTLTSAPNYTEAGDYPVYYEITYTYGLNALSNNLIMADRKKLKNPNGLILGTPGSGKSFSAKREIANAFLITQDDIAIIDPEDEYSTLVQRLGGQVVDISPTSSQYINPMDLNLNYSEDDNPLTLKSDFILSLMELIVGGKAGLEPVEKTVIYGRPDGRP